MSEQKKLKKIKSSVLSRSFQLAKLTVSTGAKLTTFGASNFLAGNKKNSEIWQQKWNAFLKDRAKDFSQDLGELKGSLMKAGQMLSMYGEHFLPPEANDLLKSLQSQSPAVAWEPIKKILKENLTSDQLAQLEIGHEPIGSASIGQVHPATIKATGQKIVLKIQYPDVHLAIDSDLKAIKSFLKVLKLLPQSINSEALFSEVRAMLIQEMDYQLEAQQTQKYALLLAQDPRFIVPRIHPEFCGKKVIASSFEEGESPDSPKVMALPQERRNRMGLNFIDLYFTEIFAWGMVQTDPHLGNYRVRINESGQDQLVLLDFGAVRNYSPSFLDHYKKMIQSSLFLDSDGLLEAAENLGFIKKSDPKDLLAAFENFCFSTVEPFMTPDDQRNTHQQMNLRGEYNWKKSDLPQRLTKEGFQMVQNFKLRPPPQEILFLDRKTGGVFIFCSVMKAEINSRQLLTKHFKDSSLKM